MNGNWVIEMKILGIETTTFSGSVALVENGRILGEFFLNVGPRHSENILPLIKELLSGLEIKLEEVEAIAVSRGPGSFTSLRVGVTTAKSLAFSLGVPIVSVSSLEVLAMGFAFTPCVICPVIDARKREVFSAFFKFSGNNLKRLSDDVLISPEGLSELVREETIFAGDGAILYSNVLRGKLWGLALFPPFNFNFPRASNCALLGGKRLREKGEDDLADLTPQYVRRAEAEILREG